MVKKLLFSFHCELCTIWFLCVAISALLFFWFFEFLDIPLFFHCQILYILVDSYDWNHLNSTVSTAFMIISIFLIFILPFPSFLFIPEDLHSFNLLLINISFPFTFSLPSIAFFYFLPPTSIYCSFHSYSVIILSFPFTLFFFLWILFCTNLLINYFYYNFFIL